MKKIRSRFPYKTIFVANCIGSVVFLVLLAGYIYLRATTDNTYYTDPDDCRAYFEYDNGVKIKKCCPDGLLFCPELQACVFPGTPGCMFDCLVPASPCVPGNSNDQKGAKAECKETVEVYETNESGWSWGINVKLWLFNGTVSNSSPNTYTKTTKEAKWEGCRLGGSIPCDGIPCL